MKLRSTAAAASEAAAVLGDCRDQDDDEELHPPGVHTIKEEAKELANTQAPTPPEEGIIIDQGSVPNRKLCSVQGREVIDLTMDDINDAQIKAEGVEGLGKTKYDSSSTISREETTSRGVSLIGDEDEEDLRDELRQIEIKRTLRAMEKRKAASAKPGT